MTLLLTLGPISLPTVQGDLVEAVGDQLEVVGAGVVAGERRPRARNLTIPVHADIAAADRWDAGNRMRRQVRALMQNSQARLQGLYFNWAADPELNAWLLIGGGDLKYAYGGISLADYALELSECYVAGNRRTHRPARRLLSNSRGGLGKTADILSEVTGTGTTNAAARHYLGVGVTDVRVGSTGAIATTTALSTRDGSMLVVLSLTDGEVLDYEQGESDMLKAIVTVLDDHGTATESVWEAVYGPDQPLTGTPLLDNAVCRAIPNTSTGHIEVQSWTGAAWVTNATILHPSGASGFACRVHEWTTERAVLRITSLLSAGVRGDMYVTLQRGWTGPRTELYARNAAGSATASVSVVVKSTGNATYQKDGMGSPGAITAGTSYGNFTGGAAPFVSLVGPGTDLGLSLAVQQTTINLRGVSNASREGLTIESPNQWAGLDLAIGPRATALADAGAFDDYAMNDSQQIPELVAR